MCTFSVSLDSKYQKNFVVSNNSSFHKCTSLDILMASSRLAQPRQTYMRSLDLSMIIFTLPILMLLAGCGSSSYPASTPLSNQSVTSTFIPASTISPIPTRTVSFAASPTFAPTSLPGLVPSGARTRFGKGEINGTALSPDGRFFAVAGKIGLFLYNAVTFEPVWFNPTAFPTINPTFSQDSKNLAAIVMEDSSSFPTIGFVTLWDVSSGQKLRSFHSEEGGRSYYRNFAISPDGKMLVVVRGTGGLDIWEIASGKKINLD